MRTGAAVHPVSLAPGVDGQTVEEALLAVVRHMLKARVVMPDGTKIAVTEGTPQGEEKSGVRPPHEVHFLGFRFQCRQTAEGWQTAILLSAKAERRLRTTVRELTPPNWGRSLAACMKDLSRYLNGWVAHFRLCTAEAVRALQFIDAHIRRRLRAIIIRQPAETTPFPLPALEVPWRQP